MGAAFVSAVTGRSVFGNKMFVWGTYAASGGSTGGDVTTGLSTIDMFNAQAGGAAVVADSPTLNETLPKASDGATIIVTADTTGFWSAFGTKS